MKRTFRHFAFGMLLLLAGACGRHKIIPDNELARIFHDAFLTNAYVGTQGVSLDSLNIYEPIFTQYGYTTADVQYTIGNFSKRKSARLGDIVERAIEMLEKEGAVYNKEVAVLDTVDNVARRTFTRTVYRDTLIRVRSLRDTAKLRIAVYDLRPGEYNVRLKYEIDSLDRNPGLKGAAWTQKQDSSRSNYYSFFLRRDREESFTRRFTVDTTIRGLHLDFAVFRDKPKRPSVTLRDLEIEYVPPTETAVDSLYLQQLHIRIFADEFIRTPTATPAPGTPDSL